MLGGKWQYKYSRPNFQCLMAILFCLCMLATCSDCINVKQLLITLICTSCRCGRVRDSYSGWSHWHCSTPLVSAWSLQGGKSHTWTRYELTWLQREKKDIVCLAFCTWVVKSTMQPVQQPLSLWLRSTWGTQVAKLREVSHAAGGLLRSQSFLRLHIVVWILKVILNAVFVPIILFHFSPFLRDLAWSVD